jgi:phosphomannomutase/phosphoglucomutase
LVALLLVAGTLVLVQQLLRQAAADNARDMARSVAAALAGQVATALDARRELLLALADGGVAAALRSADPALIRDAEEALQRRVQGLLRIRLLAGDVNQPDTTGTAPMGYAGLDLVRRTAASDRPPAAEIHQIESGSPYLATAMRVGDGVLFAAWDLGFLSRMVEQSPSFPGRLQLVQVGGGGSFVVARGPGTLEGALDAGAEEVPNSIWRIAYGVMPQSDPGAYLMLLGLAGAAGLALILTLYLQWRGLARDLRADMAAMVNLAEAIMRREGAAAPLPQLAVSRDPLNLLAQYTREARETGLNGAGVRRPTPAQPVAEQGAQGVEVEELETDPAELLAAAGRTPGKVEVPESLFRAYDVRGVVGEALTPELAELLGRALATLVREQGGHRVAVARDTRMSSAELASALVQGLRAGGCDVLDIGQAATPLLNFALHTQPVQAGVVVTGSHNPPAYNGFKIMLGERVLDGDGLLELRRRMMQGAFSQGNGGLERIDLLGEYTEAVAREVQLARPLRVVVDGGNGAAGELAVATLESLGCEVVPLFCEPDGSFPNHHPDPSQPDNLASLILEVQAQGADVGIALDGDGDRLGLVDEKGETVWPDSLLMLLAADVLGRHPGVDVLYDVKSSRHLAGFILGHGGRPIMWKSGHSRMRAKMLETGALLGGEFSGHVFIKDRWYGFDDAIYAAVRVLELLALDSRPASEVFAELPSSPSTPEYHLMLAEGQSRNLMRALDAHKVFDDARLVELDGLRVEFANGWGLIRPSNTTPALTFRFEADDPGALESIKDRFRDLLRRVAPDMQAPF